MVELMFGILRASSWVLAMLYSTTMLHIKGTKKLRGKKGLNSLINACVPDMGPSHCFVGH